MSTSGGAVDASFNDKVQAAFTQTADRAEEAGYEDWADRIRVAESIWSKEEAGHPGLTDYEKTLLALDATIAAQAAGPGSGMVVQWRQVARQRGPDPDALPEAGLVGEYLTRVGPLRLARSLALLMLDPTNPDRANAPSRDALDRIAAGILLGDAVKATRGANPRDKLIRVTDEVLGLLEPEGEGVQNTRSRIQYMRRLLIEYPSTREAKPNTFVWPTAQEAAEAVATVAGILHKMGALFRGHP